MPKSPQDLYAEAQALKARWIEKEAEAIQAALKTCDWFEAPAARLLGIPRGTLKQLLLTRHKEVGEEALRQRDKAGYLGGRPGTGGK
jgi:transcriptional regulator with GAF, ATPase, and Fis domain